MSKHLEFFTDLVFNREDLNLDSDFLGNEELKAKGFVLVPFEDELVYWLSEMVEENIHTIDFKEIIQQSKSNKEYRLTIRYYYLWLLKSLSDKEIIEWDIEKTNSDYLYEIKNSAIKSQFEYVSYLYNYIWYGEFELDEVTFIKAKKAFDNLINSLGA